LTLVLLKSGGLDSLKNCSIVAAFPLAIIMLLSCVCLIKALRSEDTKEK
jgi:glycine betaine transporter